MNNEFNEFNEKLAAPRLRLIVDGDGGATMLTVSWYLRESDASCWRRPLEIKIQPCAPVNREKRALWESERFNQWESNSHLSREDARLLRDFLSSLLKSPDFREEDE